MTSGKALIKWVCCECCTVEVEADSPDLAKHLAFDVLSELEIDPWEAELGGYMGDPMVRNVEELN